ncbi:unnamed protein product [marine sediment metagenome]|uniref:Major facilitator superfamily (MFS) profile domain-containing protein n=1 Tax=marine sediment metagenome TaxID=412755 RepID=X1LB85_9ZZZZ
MKILLRVVMYTGIGLLVGGLFGVVAKASGCWFVGLIGVGAGLMLVAILEGEGVFE